MMADNSLEKEIVYLTSLIQAHKKSSHVPKPASVHHQTRGRGDNGYSHRLNHSNKSKLKNRVLHGNRVYKPTEAKSSDTDKSTSTQQIRTSVIPQTISPVNYSRGNTTKPRRHSNRVYKPNSSDGPVTSSTVATQSSRVVEATKVNKSTGSKFKWKRRSVSDEKLPSTTSIEGPKKIMQPPLVHKTTPKRLSHKRPTPLPKNNTKYKWKRRSSTGSKEKSGNNPISPLIAQSKFKLTRASLLKSHSVSPFSRRGGTFRQRRLSYRRKNLLRATPLSARKKSLRKSKNKVWIATNSVQSSLGANTSPAASSNMIGREVKTSRGNKLWIASGLKSPTPKRRGGGLISLRGDSFVQDWSGKTLKRLNSVSKLAQAVRRRSSSNGPVVKAPSVKQYLASRVVRKSRKYVWNSKYKDKSKQYCMFFNKFGKCNHRDTCPYIHDPDKIAVCTKFLRGVCDKTDGNCPFSHKISKEKMPVCSYFLRGLCGKEDCPYLHVSVGREAQLCMDFVKGYCPRGEECTMQHLVDCPEYLEKGACSRGKACPLRHRERLYKARQEKAKQTKPAPVSLVKEPYAFKVARRTIKKRGRESSPTTPDTSVMSSSPLDMSSAPDFIAL